MPQRLDDHRPLDLVHASSSRPAAAPRRLPAWTTSADSTKSATSRLLCVLTSTARSTHCRSCRTLPGHGCAFSQRAAAARDRQRLALVDLRRPLQESRAEDGDVVGPLAERRQVNRHQVDAVEQVFAELARATPCRPAAGWSRRRRARRLHGAGSSPAPRRCGPAARAASSPATADRGRRSRRGRSCRRAPSRTGPCGRRARR